MRHQWLTGLAVEEGVIVVVHVAASGDGGVCVLFKVALVKSQFGGCSLLFDRKT